MAQSLAKILLHLVFSTKERRPFLKDQALREELQRYLGGILTNLQCQPLIIGGRRAGGASSEDFVSGGIPPVVAALRDRVR